MAAPSLCAGIAQHLCLESGYCTALCRPLSRQLLSDKDVHEWSGKRWKNNDGVIRRGMRQIVVDGYTYTLKLLLKQVKCSAVEIESIQEKVEISQKTKMKSICNLSKV